MRFAGRQKMAGVLAGIAYMVVSAAAPAAERTLLPVADRGVSDTPPDSPHAEDQDQEGTAPRMEVGHIDGFQSNYILMRFDLGGLAGQSVKRAVLRLDVIDLKPAPKKPAKAPLAVVGLQLAEPWTVAADATTSNGKTAWPGGRGSISEVTGPVAATATVTGKGAVEFDVTDLVRRWAAGEQANSGLMVRLDPAETRADPKAAFQGQIFVHSTESKSTASRPVLVVETE